MKQKIRNEISRFFYIKDYDTKCGISADQFADDLMSWIGGLIPNSEVKETKQETVTIQGVTYTLEEIKK